MIKLDSIGSGVPFQQFSRPAAPKRKAPRWDGHLRRSPLVTAQPIAGIIVRQSCSPRCFHRPPPLLHHLLVRSGDVLSLRHHDHQKPRQDSGRLIKKPGPRHWVGPSPSVRPGSHFPVPALVAGKFSLSRTLCGPVPLPLSGWQWPTVTPSGATQPGGPRLP